MEYLEEEEVELLYQYSSTRTVLVLVLQQGIISRNVLRSTSCTRIRK